MSVAPGGAGDVVESVREPVATVRESVEVGLLVAEDRTEPLSTGPRPEVGEFGPEVGYQEVRDPNADGRLCPDETRIGSFDGVRRVVRVAG